MPSSKTLIIELPPEGTLAKDLVKAAANLMLLAGNATIQQYGSVLKIEGPLSDILATTENHVRRLIEIKHKVNIRWPYLHQDDKGTLKRSQFMATRKEGVGTYGDLAKEYIKLLPELAKLGTIKFAEGEISMLQLFKVEFYETALSYNKPYCHKIEIKTNDYMLALILTGLATAYIGFIEILVPNTIEDECVARAYNSLVISNIYRRGIRTDPVIPYVFYNHVVVRRMTREAQELLDIPSSFTVHRILPGKTFTEVSREEIKISRELLDFMHRLSDKCLDELMELVQLASGAADTVALNALTFLYEAINRAMDLGFALYYLARVLTDINSARRHVLISKECFESITTALTRGS